MNSYHFAILLFKSHGHSLRQKGIRLSAHYNNIFVRKNAIKKHFCFSMLCGRPVTDSIIWKGRFFISVTWMWEMIDFCLCIDTIPVSLRTLQKSSVVLGWNSVRETLFISEYLGLMRPPEQVTCKALYSTKQEFCNLLWSCGCYFALKLLFLFLGLFPQLNLFSCSYSFSRVILIFRLGMWW